MIVALTTWRRAGYLRETLEALERAAEACPEPVRVIACAEPGHEDVLAVLDEFNVVTRVHEERVGHVANIRQAFEDGFAVAAQVGGDEDFVMHLSDDLVLAEDALACQVYMRGAWRDHSDVICTCLFSKAEPPAARYRETALCRAFNSQGFGTWAEEWGRFAEVWEPVTTKTAWGKDPEEYRGIDRSIREDLIGLDTPYMQARPILSRVRHIGMEDGMHTTPGSFESDRALVTSDEVQLPDVEWWTAVRP